jgi:hypothetical protein
MEVPPAAPWPVPRVACDHRTPVGRRLRSTHQTSAGTVAYARCACGTWLVLLDGQPLATAGQFLRGGAEGRVGDEGRHRRRRQAGHLSEVVRQQGGTND